MWRKNVTNFSYDDFSDIIRDKKVVLLYPGTNHRNLYLSYFLNVPDRQLLYFRLSPEHATINDFLSSLIEQWNEDTLPFGDKTRQALSRANSATIAQTFAQELDSISGTSLLYLDELDHLELTDNYRSFFSTLVENLPQQIQLAVNARVLTTEPWQEMVKDDVAAVLGTGYRSSNLMFSLDEADKPQLEILAFGSGRAIANGLTIASWDGALPRNLFFYFIDKDLITRDEIFKVFWPNLNVKEATNVFHVTKRKIGERISAHILGNEEYELTNYFGGFYRPGDKIARHYDVAEFVDLVDQATMTFDDEKQAMLYRRAVDIYKAPFLLTIDMPWVHERREKLQRLLLEALIGLARYHNSINNPEEALGYFMLALREVPEREDIHREVMKLYQSLGRPKDAIRQYHMLEELLQDTLGVPPGEETQSLFLQIQS